MEKLYTALFGDKNKQSRFKITGGNNSKPFDNKIRQKSIRIAYEELSDLGETLYECGYEAAASLARDELTTDLRFHNEEEYYQIHAWAFPKGIVQYIFGQTNPEYGEYARTTDLQEVIDVMKKEGMLR